jgi:hypothetical protein
MALWIIVVGAGSSIFTLPNTRAITGSVAPEMRGLARGTRTHFEEFHDQPLHLLSPGA